MSFKKRREGLKPDLWYGILSTGFLLLAGTMLVSGIIGSRTDFYYIVWGVLRGETRVDLLLSGVFIVGYAYIAAGLAGIGVSSRYKSALNIALVSSIYSAMSILVAAIYRDRIENVLQRLLEAIGSGNIDVGGIYTSTVILFLAAGVSRATRWYIGLPLAMYGLYELWAVSKGGVYQLATTTLSSIYVSLIFLYTGLASSLWWVAKGRRETQLLPEIKKQLARRSMISQKQIHPSQQTTHQRRKRKLPPECLRLSQWPRLLAESEGREMIEKCWVKRNIYGYYVEQVLGVGGYGVVLMGRSTRGRRAAIKVILPVYGEPGKDKRKSTILASEMLGSLYKESASLKELSEKSSFIVRLIGVYYDEDHFRESLRNPELFLEYPPAIVMEYMGGGDLNKLIGEVYSRADQYRRDSSWHKAVSAIIAITAKALEAIHSEGYVHSDVKPHNILFNKKPPLDPILIYKSIVLGVKTRGERGVLPKLSDLGSAVKEGSELQGYTPIYAPPEIIEYYEIRCSEPSKAKTDPWCARNKPLASASQDIFALGMTALQALGVLTPEGLFALQLNTNPSNLRYMLPQVLEQLNVPAVLRPIISSMLDPKPQKRPSAERVAKIFAQYAGIEL